MAAWAVGWVAIASVSKYAPATRTVVVTMMPMSGALRHQNLHLKGRTSLWEEREPKMRSPEVKLIRARVRYPRSPGGRLKINTAEEFRRRGRGGGGDGAEVGPEEAQTLGEKGTGGGKMRVVEVTDLFRTMKGLKCTLGEAYTCCFGRTEEVWTDD